MPKPFFDLRGLSGKSRSRAPRAPGFMPAPAIVYNRPARALTTTETCVALMCATGLSDRSIAFLLDTTDAVVGNWMRKIMAKTGAETKLQLANWYAERHLDV